ncbi:putative ester cyclase [Pseudonocardia hierapolitana]|uniref:Putative ester cyclase n=1 Tax=Pseudonocardia hierapolitana TaxID=1128676 RepID=A0A561SMA5_9PSEU|nr:ester cyclase [Pseudonocardia hierapolitana]TWF75962.1 putative ester cyclase [Pseudonocardia hierapolitana]
MTGAGYAYCEAGTGGRIDDIDDVLAALERLRGAVPDTRAEVGRVLGDADVTVAELVWSATIAQRRLRVVDRMWARWADGKVVAEWHEVGVPALIALLAGRDPAGCGVTSAAPGGSE